MRISKKVLTAVAFILSASNAGAVGTIQKSVDDMDRNHDGRLSFSELRVAGANPIIALVSDTNGDRHLTWRERKNYRDITRKILAIQSNKNLKHQNRTMVVIEFGLASRTSALWKAFDRHDQTSVLKLQSHFQDLAIENGLLADPNRFERFKSDSDDDDQPRVATPTVAAHNSGSNASNSNASFADAPPPSSYDTTPSIAADINPAPQPDSREVITVPVN